MNVESRLTALEQAVTLIQRENTARNADARDTRAMLAMVLQGNREILATMADQSEALRVRQEMTDAAISAIASDLRGISTQVHDAAHTTRSLTARLDGQDAALAAILAHLTDDPP